MIRERVTVSDYRKISLENEYYIWNFLQKKQNLNFLNIWSIFDKKEDDNPKHKLENHIQELLEIFPISYYESYVEDSMDFLQGIGFSVNSLYELPENNETRWMTRREHFYKPVVVLFKKFTPISSTRNYCYCTEGITEMLIQHCPSIVEQAKID